MKKISKRAKAFLFSYEEALKPCLNKVKYVDYLSMEKARREISAKYKKHMKYYECKFCDGFHLTTK